MSANTTITNPQELQLILTHLEQRPRKPDARHGLEIKSNISTVQVTSLAQFRADVLAGLRGWRTQEPLSPSWTRQRKAAQPQLNCESDQEAGNEAGFWATWMGR